MYRLKFQGSAAIGQSAGVSGSGVAYVQSEGVLKARMWVSSEKRYGAVGIARDRDTNVATLTEDGNGGLLTLLIRPARR